LAKPNAIQQLTADLNGYGVDIAVISETHLKSKHTDNIFNIAGYQLFRRDRLKRKAVYIQSELETIELRLQENNTLFALLWLNVRCCSRNVIVGSLYHLPKPIYETDKLLDYIETSLDVIAVEYLDALVILAGYLNTLSDPDIVARMALTSIVNEPTRGRSALDRIYTSEPCYQSIKVIASVVKNYHKAVIAYVGDSKLTVS
jgi:hypothetical protein